MEDDEEEPWRDEALERMLTSLADGTWTPSELDLAMGCTTAPWLLQTGEIDDDRRRAAGLAAWASVRAAEEAEASRKAYTKSKIIAHYTWEQYLARTTDADFRERLRMTKDEFGALFAIVGRSAHLVRDPKFCLRPDVVPVDAQIILACAVMLLGGARARHISNAFELATSTVRLYVHLGIQAILEHRHEFIDPRPLHTPSKVMKLAHDFNKLTFKYDEGVRTMQNCCGALDGIVVQIKKPSALNDGRYYNRKGYFAVVVQAMCDADYKFTFVSSKAVGSTSDSQAFQNTELAAWLDDHLLDIGDGRHYWIAADGAYTASRYILTPFKKKADIDYVSFNEKLSSLRVHIEMAFGQLVAKFAILQAPIAVKMPESASAVVDACMCLHNFCKMVGAEDMDLEEMSLSEVPDDGELDAHAADTAARHFMVNGNSFEVVFHDEQLVEASPGVAAPVVAEAPSAGDPQGFVTDLRTLLMSELVEHYRYDARKHSEMVSRRRQAHDEAIMEAVARQRVHHSNQSSAS